MPLADDVAAALDRLAPATSYEGDDDLIFADPASGEPLGDRALLRR